MQHLYTYINPVTPKHMEQACRVLAEDGVLAYPTDVNWGLGCSAMSPKALARLLLLKPHHQRQQPFTLVCSSLSMVADIAMVHDPVFRVLRKLMPGTYTFLLPPSRNLPREIDEKRKTVGVRIPDSPLLLALVAQWGHPLITTSLVLPDQHDPQQEIFGYHVAEWYGHGLDLLLDLGTACLPLETSIIDWTSAEPVIVRRGVGDVGMFET